MTRHWVIPFKIDQTERNPKTEVEKIMFSNEEKSEKQWRENLEKLHQQFGHPKTEKLLEVIKRTDRGEQLVQKFKMKEKLESIENECDACKCNVRQERPKHSLSRATNFSECLAIDLFEIVFNGEKKLCMHMIDEYSRYSIVSVINNKEKESIIASFAEHWIAKFGPP